LRTQKPKEKKKKEKVNGLTFLKGDNKRKQNLTKKKNLGGGGKKKGQKTQHGVIWNQTYDGKNRGCGGEGGTINKTHQRIHRENRTQGKPERTTNLIRGDSFDNRKEGQEGGKEQNTSAPIKTRNVRRAQGR